MIYLSHPNSMIFYSNQNQLIMHDPLYLILYFQVLNHGIKYCFYVELQHPEESHKHNF